MVCMAFTLNMSVSVWSLYMDFLCLLYDNKNEDGLQHGGFVLGQCCASVQSLELPSTKRPLAMLCPSGIDPPAHLTRNLLAIILDCQVCGFHVLLELLLLCARHVKFVAIPYNDCYEVSELFRPTVKAGSLPGHTHQTVGSSLLRHAKFVAFALL